MENFTRDDIYNIIVPIGLVMLGWITQYLTSQFGREKQWKNAREKSSAESFFDYFLIVYVFGIVWLILFVFFVFAVETVFEISLSKEFVKYSYIVFTICPYAISLTGKREKEFAFKKKHKHDKWHSCVIEKIAIILPCVLWSTIFFDNAIIIAKVGVVLTLLFEILSLVVLDNKRKFKYEFATFHFYDGKSVDNIAVDKICQKGNWIIAEDEGSKMEYRFRTKDIERVEYSNAMSGDRCVP